MISKTLPAAIAAAYGLMLVSASAATYTTGFGNAPGDAAYVVTDGDPPVNQALVGQDGWYTNDTANPKVSFMAAPGGNNVGAIGGFYVNPNFLTTYVGRDFSGGIVNTDFNAVLNITQSVNFPGADEFGWSFLDGNGNAIFSLIFTPDTVNSTLYNVGWSVGAGPVTTTGASFFASTSTALQLDFSGSGADALFSGSVTTVNDLGVPVSSPAPFGGTITGAGDDVIESFGALWLKGAPSQADNFMIFDNVSIPEPTGLALAGVALGGMMLRRRRA